MTKRRSLAIAATAVLIAAVAVIVVSVSTGTDEAQATLPPSLEKSITSSQVGRSVNVDPNDASEVTLDGGTKVFLVPGDDGDACIGLADGSAACGPSADVAAGRLFLIAVPASGEPQRSAIPVTGTTKATVYGYQPDDRAARASILGAEGQVLGSGDIVDGLYGIEITTDAHSRRFTGVRFDAADESSDAPAPVNLDQPGK
jgi:hypothetical protein